MNNRGLKTRTPLSNTVDTKLYDKLKELSDKTRIPMSKLLDEALELLFEKHSDSLKNP